jgi:hypothetical protein
MIEFSFAELFLLAWAVLATVLAISKVQETRAAKNFIHTILDDDALRNEIVSSYKMFREANRMSKDSIALTVVVALAIIVMFFDFMYWRPL